MSIVTCYRFRQLYIEFCDDGNIYLALSDGKSMLLSPKELAKLMNFLKVHLETLAKGNACIICENYSDFECRFDKKCKGKSRFKLDPEIAEALSKDEESEAK